jgi:hypothetical protein
MNIVVVQLSSIIRWKCTEDSPISEEIQSNPFRTIVNPLVLHSLLHRQETSFEKYIFRCGFKDAELVVFTDIIGIVVDENLDLLEEFDLMHNFIPQLLDALRCASGQAYITSSSLRMMSIIQTPELPKLEFPSREFAEAGVMESYAWTSAILAEDIKKTKELLGANYLPQYSIIFLDAVHAFLSGDFRKCIVYSAMSMEIVSASVLEKIYEERKSKEGTNANDLRVMSVPRPNGQTAMTDPIFDRLNEIRDKKLRLHEIPLYLLHRSILVENETLYQNAIKVYKARDNIVHYGHLDEQVNRTV